MNPNFDKIKNEITDDPEIIEEIAASLAQEFGESFHEYNIYKHTQEKEKFEFSFHKIINSIGILNIAEDLEKCRTYYLTIKASNTIFIDQEVEKILQKVEDFLEEFR